jgi:hypothetical protein
MVRQELLDVGFGRFNYQLRVLRGGLVHHEQLVPLVQVVRAAWSDLEEAAPPGLVQPTSAHAVLFRPCKRKYGHGGKNNQLADLKH